LFYIIIYTQRVAVQMEVLGERRKRFEEIGGEKKKIRLFLADGEGLAARFLRGGAPVA